MRILTTALYVIVISFFRGAKAAHGRPYEDAFGLTNYGIQCEDRVYRKFVLFAAAKHFCDITQGRAVYRWLSYDQHGFRNKRAYESESIGFVHNLVMPNDEIVPIFADGTLYPFNLPPEKRLVKNSAGQMVKLVPGPDRLIMDSNCNIRGAFSDLDYQIDTRFAKVKACTVIKAKQPYLSPANSFGSDRGYLTPASSFNSGRGYLTPASSFGSIDRSQRSRESSNRSP